MSRRHSRSWFLVPQMRGLPPSGSGSRRGSVASSAGRRWIRTCGMKGSGTPKMVMFWHVLPCPLKIASQRETKQQIGLNYYVQTGSPSHCVFERGVSSTGFGYAQNEFGGGFRPQAFRVQFHPLLLCRMGLRYLGCPELLLVFPRVVRGRPAKGVRYVVMLGLDQVLHFPTY